MTHEAQAISHSPHAATRRLRVWLLLGLLPLVGWAQVNTDHMMMVGRNALYFNDYVLSIQYFNQVVNAKPYRSEPYFFRGLAKFYLDDYAGADADCSAAIERNPFVADSYQLRGLSRARLGRYDDAIADYRAAIALDPQNAGLRHNLAVCYGNKHDYAAAIGVLDTLRATVPSYAPALTMRAQAHMQQNDTVAALDDIQQSLELDRYDPATYTMRAIIYLQQERYADAEDDLTYALHLQPSADIYINRALARYHQQKLRDAMSDYDTAIDMEPSSFIGHFNRGLMRAQVGDDNRAIEDFNVVLDQEPDNAIALLNRALLCARVGEWKQAEEDYTAILEQYPRFIMGYQERADVRRKLGKRRAAEQDELVVLRAQFGDFDDDDEGEADNDTDADDDATTRRKSDGDLRHYNRMVVADEDVSLDGTDYATDYRGRVQNRNVHVELMPLYALTYYERPDPVSRDVRYHRDIADLSSRHVLPLSLLVTADEQPLDEEQIARHFADIDEQSARIAANPDDALPLFARALDFYLVQDLASAIDDYNAAIAADGSFWAAYFNRATARYRQALIEEEEGNDADEFTDAQQPHVESAARYQLILADLGKVIDLAPDFAYAYYDRAAVYCRQGDYPAAIVDLNEALRLCPTMAEAYYNRGLAHLYLGHHDLGIADLSKAGELGLYTAYNLIKRFSKGGQ